MGRDWGVPERRGVVITTGYLLYQGSNSNWACRDLSAEQQQANPQEECRFCWAFKYCKSWKWRRCCGFYDLRVWHKIPSLCINDDVSQLKTLTGQEKQVRLINPDSTVRPSACVKIKCSRITRNGPVWSKILEATRVTHLTPPIKMRPMNAGDARDAARHSQWKCYWLEWECICYTDPFMRKQIFPETGPSKEERRWLTPDLEHLPRPNTSEVKAWMTRPMAATTDETFCLVQETDYEALNVVQQIWLHSFFKVLN